MSVGRGVLFKKTTVESCCGLDMTFLAKQINLDEPGITQVSWRGSWGKRTSIIVFVRPPERIALLYKLTRGINGEIGKYAYYVYLDTTPCYFGNKRWWFLCPVCNRRCRVLYLPGWATHFACRICHDLTYESRQEGHSRWFALFRAMNEGFKLEEKLRRARSPRSRERIARKLFRMTGGLQAMIDYYNEKLKGRSR